MAKKQYYAVVKGRTPGIYAHWSGAGGAEEQVKGFPGALFRGFASREEAEAFFRSNGKYTPPVPIFSGGEPALPSDRQSPPSADFQSDLDAGSVVIFTDGASSGNPGPGGYGVVLRYGSTRRELSGGFRCTTNNRMELMACIVGLRAITRAAPVVLFSDSRYVVEAVNKGWAARWRENGWLRAPNASGDRQPAENMDLWEALLDLLDRFQVTFRWVRGHANHPENERCDRLAVQASRAPGLPPDTGFRGSC